MEKFETLAKMKKKYIFYSGSIKLWRERRWSLLWITNDRRRESKCNVSVDWNISKGIIWKLADKTMNLMGC